MWASAAAAEDVPTLAPADAAIERRIETGQEDRYQFPLTADERVDLIVDQRGVGLALQVRDPDGAPIADFDGDVNGRGEERFDIVANHAGMYTLIITPLDDVPVEPRSSYAIQLANQRAATAVDRAMRDSRRLRATAVRLRSEGKLDEARTQLERAAQLAEEAHAPDAYIGTLLGELGGAVMMRREYKAAEPVFLRALAALEQAFGREHPVTALVRSRLAVLYQNTSQFLNAETEIQSALTVMEKTVGTEHPWFVRCLVPLANLRDDMGDLDTSEAINRRGLAILERLQQTDTLLYADLLNNLGNVLREKRAYARAEELFSRSLAIGEKLRGPDSEYVASELQNLGIVSREQSNYAAAESYYARALAIRERLVGPDHSDVAQLLNNLATIYHARGDDAHALETFFRAMRIWQNTGGPYHRGMLLVMGNVARTYASMGDIPHAMWYQRRTDMMIERQLELNLVVGSERQKLASARSMAERTDRTISLHLRQARDDDEAAALATLVLLQRKGRVLDAMTDTFAAVRQHEGDTGDRDLLDELNVATAQLARLAFAGTEETTALDDRQRQISELENRIDRVQGELSRHSAAFRAAIQPVTLEAVQAAMPRDAALIEFAVFRPFDPKAPSNDTAYGPPHYAAYVVRKDATPIGRDLGPADAIDKLVALLREALHDPRRRDVRLRARAVDELILRPLRAMIGDATRLLISPDGELHLVPFEALVDERGTYMIERYAIGYLTSGRDLLRMQADRPSRSGPVVIADPLFGESAKPGIYFAPLAGTAVEARAIKSLFPDARVLMGRDASKSTLLRLDAPSVLHIASHGFFLQDATHDAAAPRQTQTRPHPQPQTQAAAAAVPIGRAVRGGASKSGGGNTHGSRTGNASGGTRAISGSVQIENPLLRSGLALAGANLRRAANDPARDDGILTALEASSLNLWGTKLVTLSACDTGVGEVRNGEGVYGLRRAFVLAGAETLVMSLWPVSDYVARETMTVYYAGLRAGLGRGEALRQAKLALLKRRDRRHPFYWASFIQSGEWASLEGRR